MTRATQFELTTPTHISGVLFDIRIQDTVINLTTPSDTAPVFGNFDYEFYSFISGDVYSPIIQSGPEIIKQHVPATGIFHHANNDNDRLVSIAAIGNAIATSRKDYLLEYDKQLDPGLYWVGFRRKSRLHASITNLRLSYENEATTVPEPSTLLLLSPMIGLCFLRRKNKEKVKAI